MHANIVNQFYYLCYFWMKNNPYLIVICIFLQKAVHAPHPSSNLNNVVECLSANLFSWLFGLHLHLIIT